MWLSNKVKQPLKQVEHTEPSGRFLVFWGIHGPSGSGHHCPIQRVCFIIVSWDLGSAWHVGETPTPSLNRPSPACPRTAARSRGCSANQLQPAHASFVWPKNPDFCFSQSRGASGDPGGACGRPSTCIPGLAFLFPFLIVSTRSIAFWLLTV